MTKPDFSKPGEAPVAHDPCVDLPATPSPTDVSVIMLPTGYRMHCGLCMATEYGGPLVYAGIYPFADRTRCVHITRQVPRPSSALG